MRFVNYCLCVLILTAVACARQGYPEGGMKDTTPPKVTEERPVNGTLNFGEKSFYIGFDEYVVLNDVENNIIVSPPMKPKPTFTSKHRGIQVTINDTLKENTTYLFQFKNAIADLNEGNKLQSYEYAFSTGLAIDSMELRGRLLDAYTLKPRKSTATLMLYPSDSKDSAITNSAPSHVTRCDDKGYFQFSHIRPGTYKLVGIEDGDKDFRYGDNEAIAFLNEEVFPLPPNDSSDEGYLMLMSYEERQIQRVTQSKFEREGYAEITSLMPMLKPNIVCDTPIFWQLSTHRDTLRIWTRNPKGSLLNLTLGDSSGLQDTIKMQWRPKRKGREKNTVQDKWCNWGFTTSTPYFQPLTIRFKNPIDKGNSLTDSAVIILRLSDSNQSVHALVLDSSLLFATIDFTPLVGEKYTICISGGKLYDIYGNSSDTLRITTEIQGDDKFGNISVSLADAAEGIAYVVQVTDESGDVKQSLTATSGQKITFRQLKPGNYRVQAYADHDKNGQWTPGNYWMHRQPEEVYYLGKTLNLRANWDIEEILSTKHITPQDEATDQQTAASPKLR
ncbi:MAG: Ig-like domain-containing protein [Bacteroidales bacterium]|nr:Ig-like domain-containing protein [Bacteroidales bacterium]